MRKILILCIFFLLFHKVQALEEDWTDEVIDDSNVVIKDSEIRYRWYQEQEVLSDDYYIEGENDETYPFIIRDNIIQTDWSDWLDTSPKSKPNRDIEYKMVNRYRTIKPVRYLFLNNFQGGYLTFKIAELNVLINNVEINVTMNCNNCSDNFIYHTNDNSLNNVAYINNGGSLTIDLGAYYLVGDIRLELYMYDSVPNTKKFNLYYNGCPTLEECTYAHKEIDIYVVSNNSNLPEKHLIIPNETFIEKPIWDDWIYADTFYNATYYRQMQVLNIYRYKDIKYRYYKIERIYVDDYYAEYEDSNYIKDEESANTFYLYEYAQNDNSMAEESKNKDNNYIVDNTLNNEVEKEKTIIYEINDNLTEELKEIVSINEPKIGEIEHNEYQVEDKNNNDKTYFNSNIVRMIIIFLLLCLGLILIIFGIRRQNLSHQN